MPSRTFRTAVSVPLPQIALLVAVAKFDGLVQRRCWRRSAPRRGRWCRNPDGPRPRSWDFHGYRGFRGPSALGSWRCSWRLVPWRRAHPKGHACVDGIRGRGSRSRREGKSDRLRRGENLAERAPRASCPTSNAIRVYVYRSRPAAVRDRSGRDGVGGRASNRPNATGGDQTAPGVAGSLARGLFPAPSRSPGAVPCRESGLHEPQLY